MFLLECPSSAKVWKHSPELMAQSLFDPLFMTWALHLNSLERHCIQMQRNSLIPYSWDEGYVHILLFLLVYSVLWDHPLRSNKSFYPGSGLKCVPGFPYHSLHGCFFFLYFPSLKIKEKKSCFLLFLQFNFPWAQNTEQCLQKHTGWNIWLSLFVVHTSLPCCSDWLPKPQCKYS